ncbi:VWA domain-containing protein [Octadecabacter sp.]|nr:VWA domain-containing protein [Octadecabacter sp.]
MLKANVTTIGAIAALIIFGVLASENGTGPINKRQEPVQPNWAAITAWPNLQPDVVEAQPNPNRRVTAIVLDDSGSMGSDIVAAKAAVVGALNAMNDEDRIAVLGLNAGTILPFSSVADSKSMLTDLLEPIESDGSTPLTASIQSAQNLLEEEAAATRSFGTFRVIITTDGQANDDNALDAAIETLAATTPIQVTTIGIGIRGDHVLRRADLGSFVDVANVDALQTALQAAVAENTDFSAITNFE